MSDNPWSNGWAVLNNEDDDALTVADIARHRTADVGLAAPERPAPEPPESSWVRPEWHQHAACRGADPDLFFPDRTEVHKVQEAKEVCAGCRVREECAAAGLPEQFGVWGGLSKKQRLVLRREAAGPRVRLGHGTAACRQRGCEREECKEAYRERQRAYKRERNRRGAA